MHLDHERTYKISGSITKNKKIRKNTRDQKICKTQYGINKEL